jgi:hypothetical protein
MLFQLLNVIWCSVQDSFSIRNAFRHRPERPQRLAVSESRNVQFRPAKVTVQKSIKLFIKSIKLFIKSVKLFIYQVVQCFHIFLRPFNNCIIFFLCHSSLLPLIPFLPSVL